MCSTASSTLCLLVSTTTSACVGGSYGSVIPGSVFSSPARARLYLPDLSLDQRLRRTFDEHFREATDAATRFVARLAIGALDCGLDDDAAPARHQLADPGELADLGIPLVLGGRAADVQHLLKVGSVEHVDDFPQATQAVGQ